MNAFWNALLLPHQGVRSFRTKNLACSVQWLVYKATEDLFRCLNVTDFLFFYKITAYLTSYIVFWLEFLCVMFLSHPCLSFKFWMNYLGALCYLNNVNYKISLSLQYKLNIIFQFSGNTPDLRYLCWNSLSFVIAVSFFKPVMALCKLAWIIIMNLGFFCIVKINALCLNIGVTALTCFSINVKFDSVYFYMVRVLLNACFDSAYFSVIFPQGLAVSSFSDTWKLSDVVSSGGFGFLLLLKTAYVEKSGEYFQISFISSYVTAKY